MPAHTDITLKHETGRIETIENVQSFEVNESANSIDVVVEVNGDVYTEEYDALSWSVHSLQHTKEPLSQV